MDEDAFWAIIQRCNDASSGDMDQKCRLIKAEIARMPEGDAISFSHLFDKMMDRAYSWPLWGAAYVINGGCGDDTFDDFRASLISRGRDAFEHAVSDPDSLAGEEIEVSSFFFEGFQYAIMQGVKANIGRAPGRLSPFLATPTGSEWSEETVRDLYPRLARKI
jgi:hypothetical protein